MFVVLTIIFGSLSFSEFYQIQQLKSPSITTSTVTVTLTPSTTVTTETLTTNTTSTLTTTYTVSVTSVLTVSSLISSAEALKAVMNFEGWNATEMASYPTYTQLRYLKEENGWVNIYTVNASTGETLTVEAGMSLQAPDPTVKLRGYYWFVDVNVAPPPNHIEGLYYDFWVNAINATIAYSEGPSP